MVFLSTIDGTTDNQGISAKPWLLQTRCLLVSKCVGLEKTHVYQILDGSD